MITELVQGLELSFGIGVKTQPAIQTAGGSGFASTNFSISGCLPLPERSREMHFF
jgi:hypothetical protein